MHDRVCATCHEAWAATDVSGAALAPRILSATGEIVAGRLVQGTAKGEGRSAPFLLDDPTPEDIAELDAIFSKYAVKLPSSGEIVFETVAYNLDRQRPEPI